MTEDKYWGVLMEIQACTARSCASLDDLQSHRIEDLAAVKALSERMDKLERSQIFRSGMLCVISALFGTAAGAVVSWLFSLLPHN